MTHKAEPRRFNRSAVQKVGYAYLSYISRVTHRLTDLLKKILRRKMLPVRYNTVQMIEHILPPDKDKIPKMNPERIN